MDERRDIKALTPSAAQEIRRLYAEVNAHGRRKHTIWELADMFGVGETTAYRAIRRIGPYASLPEKVETQDELKVMAKESEKKLIELLNASPPEAPQKPSAIDAFMQARSGDPPASPLDGGEGTGQEPVLAERMGQEIAVRDPNRLLKELKDGSE